MADNPCTPVKDPCVGRGFSWFDWAYNLHLALCYIQRWAASIYNNTRVAPYGKLPIKPVQYGFNAGPAKTIKVPEGAISIQAVIDNDYASNYRLNVKQGTGTAYDLPAGTDFNLPVVTPLYSANAEGGEAQHGYGFYPEYTFTWPAGSRGFVVALYRGTAPSLVIT